MKLTSELLYKKIDQFYHNDYINNSSSYLNLLLIKSEKSYYIYLTQKLTETLKYTTILVEKIHSGYQTQVKITYSDKYQMVPIRFQNEMVIPPPIFENLIPIFRNIVIDTVILN
jgi:hypothetical protein